MSLVDSPELTSYSTPIKTVSLPSEAYVLSLASLSSYYAASSSAPTNGIHLFDKSNLRPVAQLAGHDDAVTGLRRVPTVAGLSAEVLVSSGKDGVIRVWDERSGVAGLQSECFMILFAALFTAELKRESHVRLSSECPSNRKETRPSVL